MPSVVILSAAWASRVAIALVSGLPPAWRAKQLNIVDALAGTIRRNHEHVLPDRRRDAMNLRSLPQRLGTSLVIVIGIAGVVGVLVSVLAMSTGIIKTIVATRAATTA